MSKLILFNTNDKIILTKSNDFFNYKEINLEGIEPVLFTSYDLSNIYNIEKELNSQLHYRTAILSDDFLNSSNSFTTDVLPHCNIVSVRKHFLNSDLNSMTLITKARQLAFGIIIISIVAAVRVILKPWKTKMLNNVVTVVILFIQGSLLCFSSNYQR